MGNNPIPLRIPPCGASPSFPPPCLKSGQAPWLSWLLFHIIRHSLGSYPPQESQLSYDTSSLCAQPPTLLRVPRLGKGGLGEGAALSLLHFSFLKPLPHGVSHLSRGARARAGEGIRDRTDLPRWSQYGAGLGGCLHRLFLMFCTSLWTFLDSTSLYGSLLDSEMYISITS